MLDIEDFKKKLDKKSRLMGIDPGKKRVGIAISDENKVIATPYRTLIKVDFVFCRYRLLPFWLDSFQVSNRHTTTETLDMGYHLLS